MTLSLDLESIASIRAALASNVADARATFECSFGAANVDLGFFVFAGLAPLLELLENIKLSEDEIAALVERELLDEASALRLSRLHLACDVDAPAEGTPVFPGVPVLVVDGPFWQVELVASLACKVLARATRVATRMMRYTMAVAGLEALGARPLLELGGEEGERGPSEARLSRAAYLGGATATTSSSAALGFNVPAYVRYGSHALAAARHGELDLEAWLAAAPRGAIFSIDDTEDVLPIDRVADAAARVASRSWSEPRFALELASSDVIGMAAAIENAFRSRKLSTPPLFVRVPLADELSVREMAADLPPNVGFAVDPHQGHLPVRMTSELVALEEDGRWTPRMRQGRSLADSGVPGRKKTLRYVDANGALLADIAYASNERAPTSKELQLFDAATGRASKLMGGKNAPLHHKVLRGGRRTELALPLAELRQRALEQTAALPSRYRRLHAPARYPTGISAALLELKKREMAAR